MTEEQRGLVKSVLRTLVDQAVASTLWRLPIAARVAIGVIAFGLLFALLAK